jgi:type VI secretion system secreted protein VgrG
MAAYTQDTRLIGITTPLGKDVLLLRGFSGRESMSQLSTFDLDLLSKDPEIKFEDIIGKRVTLRVTLSEDKNRYFNGFISRFVQTGAQTGMANYRATMVPWLWFLTKTTDCRIFQNKTIPDIVQQIFKEYGFTDVKAKLQGTYEPRDYCVQYRETDYNFVARLMEQYGIFYFFEHEKEKHTLVLTDNPDAHQPCPEQPKAKWNPQGSKSLTEDVVTTLEVEKIFRPGKYALTDYNFETPSTSLLSEIDTTITVGGNTKYEVYDYPGEYEKKAQGKTLVKLRMEEQEVKHLSVTGTSSCRAFATGYRFDFEDYSRADLNQAYVLTAVSHSATVGDTYTTGKSSDGSSAYTNAFVCIPHKVPFRPPQITPKPIVQGPQTAVIVGPSGEEIYSDKYGRVKAQFHWDREGKKDENSSCWMRTSQNWAGKQWGGVFIPRIGQEVIVEFLEGDPDRPIITGRIYNAEQMPPYALPANQTQSGVKSNSSKGGGGSNEWRFEDKKGSEEIYLHGEKDWTVKIKNNESETIGSNLSHSAGGNISQSAGADISRTADDNINDSAGKNIVTKSGGSMDLTAGGSYQLFTSLGIHLKAMNFLAAQIESGAKAAAAALIKGGVAGAQGAEGGAQEKAEAAAAAGSKAALAAFGPTVSAVTEDLHARQAQAEKNMGKAEASGTAMGIAAAELNQAISSGASREVIAGAVMALASAGLETYKDAKRLIEDMLPQIPSIVMWAMKDISATALWSMSLQTKVKDIDIEAKNKNINIKAKQALNLEAVKKDANIKSKENLNLETTDKDLNLKASKKNVNITGKEKVSIKAEDKEFVIEAGKEKLTIKSPKMIMLKVKSSAVCITEDGILVSSKKVKIKGSSGPVEVKGTPIKLN